MYGKRPGIFLKRDLVKRMRIFPMSYTLRTANMPSIEEGRFTCQKRPRNKKRDLDKRAKYMESDIQKIFKSKLEKRECIYSLSYMLRITNMPFMTYVYFSLLNETYTKRDLDVLTRDLNVLGLSLGVMEKALVMFKKDLLI